MARKSKKQKEDELNDEDFIESEDLPKEPKKKGRPKKEKPEVFPDNLDDNPEETVTIQEAQEPEEKEPEPVIQHKEVEIKHAKIVDDLFCNYNYDFYKDNEFLTNIGSNKNQMPIHNDLRMAFSMMDHHLAGIMNELSEAEITEILSAFTSESLKSKLANYKVTGFKLEDKPRGISLTGTKHVILNKTAKVDTPVIEFGSGYALVEHLEWATMHVIREVELYKNGKRAPIFVQQSLDFEESDINKTIEGKKEYLNGEDKFDVEFVTNGLEENTELESIEFTDSADIDAYKGHPNFGSDFPKDEELF